MFKRLREKLVEEAAKQGPLRIPSMNTPAATTPAQLQVNDGNSFSSRPENSQFSITEDDGTSSEMGSPQKHHVNEKLSGEASNDQFLFAVPEFDIHHRSYIPPSDLESEVEDTGQSPPSTLDENITKEQLFFALQRLHARVQKYKAKYSKVAIACKEANSEKEKIMHTLTDNQDRALRRLGELKEQCNLEQQAKAHLEENLRVMLDEKDQMIGVLQTKVQLLKNGENPEKDDKENEDLVDEEKENDQDVQDLQRKVKRLEELLTRCKDALQSNKDRSSQLTLERDQLANQLEQKEQELQHVQEHEGSLQARLRGELAEGHQILMQLRKDQEESAMAMAETKRSFHQELETREQRLNQAQSECNSLREEAAILKQQFKEQGDKFKDDENKLLATVTSLENGKKDLEDELLKEKANALNLLKETSETIETKWSKKLSELEQKCEMLIEQEKGHQEEKEKIEASLILHDEDLSVKHSELTGKLEAEISKLKSDISTLEENIETWKNESEILKNSCNEKNLECETLKENQLKIISDAEFVKSCHEQLVEGLEITSKERKVLENSLMELEEEVKTLKREKEAEDSIKIRFLELTEMHDNTIIEHKLSMEKECFEMENLNLQCEKYEKLNSELKVENESLNEKLQCNVNTVSSLEKSVENFNEEIALLKETIQNIVSDINTDSVIEKSSIKSHVDQLKNCLELIKNEKQSFESSSAHFQKDIIDKDSNIERLKENISNLELRCQSTGTEQEKAQLDLINKCSDLQATISGNDRTIIELKEDITRLDSKLNESNLKSDEFEKKANELDERCLDLVQQCSEKDALVIELNEKLALLNDNNTAANTTVSEKQDIIKNLELELSENQCKLNKVEDEIEGFKIKNKQLEGENETFALNLTANECQQNKTVEELLQKIIDLEESLKNEMEKVKDSKEMEIRVFELKNEKISLQSEISILEKELQKIHSTTRELNEEKILLSTDLIDIEKIIDNSIVFIEDQEQAIKIQNSPDLKSKINIYTQTLAFEQEKMKDLKLFNEKSQAEIFELENLNSSKQDLVDQLSKIKLELIIEKESMEQQFESKLMAINTEKELLEDHLLHERENVSKIQSEMLELVKQQQLSQEKYLMLEDELNSSKNALKHKLDNLDSNDEAYSLEILTLKNELKNAFETLAEERKMKSDFSHEIMSLESEKDILLLEIRDNNNRTDDTIKKMEQSQSNLEEKCHQLELSLTEKIIQLESVNTENSEIQMQIADLTKFCQTKENQCKELMEELENLTILKSVIDERLSESNEKCQDLELQLSENYKLVNSNEMKKLYIEQKALVIQKLEEKCEKLELELSSATLLSEELDEANSSAMLLESQKNELESQYEIQRATLEAKCKTDFENVTELNKLKEELRLRDNQLDESLIVAEANKATIAKGLEERNQKLTELEEENSKLKKMLSDAESLSKVSSKAETIAEKKEVEKNDMDSKLKQLVRDFSMQMQEKEDEHEKSLSETIERYHELEEKFHWEKEESVTTLEKQLTEQNTAMEEMREHFIGQINEKDELISKLKIIDGKNSDRKLDSDWDNAWEDEPDVEIDSSKVPRLELMTSHNNHTKDENQQHTKNTENHVNSDNSHSILEPTEYEYLRNILMEYMMGKEPLILAKVISAVLRFPEEQTNEILQREEARQATAI